MIAKRLRQSLDAGISIRDIFEEGKKMTARYGDDRVYNFSIGNPTVEPPAIVNETMRNLLEQEDPLTLHGYSANAGHPDVRHHIAELLNRTWDTNYRTEGIVMTSGAASALTVLMNTLLDYGDEVVTFAPYFWEYRHYVETFYGKLVPVQSIPGTFQPDPEKLAQAVNERTRAVLINSPNNPTGVVYTAESLQNVVDVLKAKEKEYGHPVYLISDEPYRQLAYDVEVPYMTDFYRDTIVVYSYSKSLSVPGERIGYLAMQPDVTDYEDLLEGITASMRCLGFVNAPSLQQRMLLRCADAAVNIDIYRQARDILYNGLTETGYHCVYPDGAFYLFMQSLETDAVHFCETAKKREKILMAPGDVCEGPGWVRISYCVPPNVVHRSLPGFRRLYQYYEDNKGVDA